MTSEMDHIMRTATEQRQRDLLFRRHIDCAVHEAMRAFDHIDSEVDRRDLLHAATTAAMTALRLSIENDALLKGMEAQRDAAMKTVNECLLMTPRPAIIIKRGEGDGHAGVMVGNQLHTSEKPSNKTD